MTRRILRSDRRRPAHQAPPNAGRAARHQRPLLRMWRPRKARALASSAWRVVGVNAGRSRHAGGVLMPTTSATVPAKAPATLLDASCPGGGRDSQHNMGEQLANRPTDAPDQEQLEAVVVQDAGGHREEKPMHRPQTGPALTTLADQGQLARRASTADGSRQTAPSRGRTVDG